MVNEVMTDWCARCHHMIELLPHAWWAHASYDDWSGDGCLCVLRKTQCLPESSVARDSYQAVVTVIATGRLGA